MGRSRVLHVRKHVRVRVERERNAGMPQLLRYHFGRSARCECQGGCRGAKIVETNPRQLGSLKGSLEIAEDQILLD